MSSLAYTRFEVRRTIRNKRFLFFALGFPIVFYFLIAGANQDESNFGDSGLSAPLYYMTGMAAFGTMMAMVSSGARIAAERAVGWNRQLRITPLKAGTYLRSKVATGYMMALLTILALYLAGTILGVRLPAERWLEMTGLILVGLVPFAALGILVGHLLTPDSVGPAMGGGVSLLAFLGGVWFPLGNSGLLYEVGRELPSYWLVQAGHIGVGGGAWGLHGWLVMAAWTAILSVLAARAYRNDTDRP
jgi:ABC-2 type transport system permease protein